MILGGDYWYKNTGWNDLTTPWCECYGITCNEGTFAANIQQCNSYLVSSNSLFPVNLFSGSPYAYNNVIESDDSTFSNGFTEHMFHAYIPSNVLTTWLGSSTSVNATNMTTILNGLEYKTRFYPDRKGSMVPFGLRMLNAELPQYINKPDESISKLYELLNVVQEIINDLVLRVNQIVIHAYHFLKLAAQ